MIRQGWLYSAVLLLPTLSACGASPAHRVVVAPTAANTTTVTASADGPARAVTASGGEVLVVSQETGAALGLQPRDRVRAGADGRVVVQEGSEVLVEVPAEHRGPVVVVVEGSVGQPALALVPEPPAAVVSGQAEVTCGGDQRVRVHNRHVRGGDHAAIVATGACVVEVSEAIVVGSPAIVVRDQARVVVVESRLRGDIVIDGMGQVSASGSTHAGRTIRAGAQSQPLAVR